MNKINKLIMTLSAVGVFTAGIVEAQPRVPRPVPGAHMPAPGMPPVGVRYENLGTYRAEKFGTNKSFRLNSGATAARIVIVDNTVIVNNAYAELSSGELVPLNSLLGTYSRGAILTSAFPTYRGLGIQSLILETTSPLVGSRGEFSVEVGYGAIRPDPRPIPRPRPPRPVPPRPRPNPTPIYDYCDIEYSGNSYFVTRSGSRASPYYSNFNIALNEMRSMENSRFCVQDYPRVECRIEYSGNSYYINRGNVRYTPYVASLDSILQAQDDFIYNNICHAPAVWDRCSVLYSGNSYFVDRSGVRMSRFLTYHQDAAEVLDKLIQSGNCSY